MPPPIGIDLGTTFSVIAQLDTDGRPRTIPNISMCPTSILLLNDNGHSYTKQTKGRNANHKLTSYWTRLLKRVRREHQSFGNSLKNVFVIQWQI